MSEDIINYPNRKVVFSYPKNGYDYDQEIAAKYLKLGEVYTLIKEVIRACDTEYHLKEFPGIVFNCVLFDYEDNKSGDVHTRHCCLFHGCKYGDEDCTVVTGLKPQEYICETCEDFPDSNVYRFLKKDSGFLSIFSVEKMLRPRFDKNQPNAIISLDEYNAIKMHCEWLEKTARLLKAARVEINTGLSLIEDLADSQ